MTISPPSNVSLGPDEPGRALASGIDGLVLSLDIVWKDETFFWILDEAKELAKGTEAGTPIDLYDSPASFSTVNVQGYGKKGYDYLLIGGEFSLKIGHWLEPKTRPSVMAELRSEALWHHGPAALVARIRAIFERVGAVVRAVKPSRVDPCLDVLLPKSAWGPAIADHFVTRAVKTGLHRAKRKLTGITVGNGAMLARIYDKPLEIVMTSNKTWMFDIWGIESVPPEHTIARVEFQVRREALKQLGIDVWADLVAKLPELWAYCTKGWLKVQDDPGKHHTQQHTVPWWKIVQEGFLGVQNATPLVRVKAIRANEEQLIHQMVGMMASLVALRVQGFELNGERQLSIVHSLGLLRELIKELGIRNHDFTERVKLKFAKYRRNEPPKK